MFVDIAKNTQTQNYSVHKMIKLNEFKQFIPKEKLRKKTHSFSVCLG